jgi:RimJ/RimL family protein N-acetyltransferase
VDAYNLNFSITLWSQHLITEVDVQQYAAIRPLVQELAAYNVSIPALLDSNNPGRVFADDSVTPQVVFLETVEGFFLAGQPENDTFYPQFNQHIQATYHPEMVFGVETSPAKWQEKFSDLFAPRTIVNQARRHYVCTALRYTDWQQNLADGFSVRRIDADLLDNPNLTIPEHIPGWIHNNWGSREQYLRLGFGFCTLHENQVVSWSLADCTSGTRCEIGIRTHEDYRQQGLASITAAAAVHYALNNGYTEVGWHCADDNTGSWKTAEKVGFVKERDYVTAYAVPPQ